MPFMTKNVFISYSSLDKSKVQVLEKKINNTEHLKAFVVEDVRTSMMYVEKKIEHYFAKTDYFIPILTRNSINTQYLNQEIGYAAAKKKKIKPVVGQDVLEDLKGFIHGHHDLPYNFQCFSENPLKEKKTFAACCDILIQDLLEEVIRRNKDVPKDAGLSKVFKGVWQNHFKFPDGREGKEQVSIKENDRYYIGDNFMFRLDKIFISKDRKRIQFRKNGVNDGDDRSVLNDLTRIEPGVYSGTEGENTVTYTRLEY